MDKKDIKEQAEWWHRPKANKWLGDACGCRCGWTADPTTEEDVERICAKCGARYKRTSYGWCQIGNNQEQPKE